MSEHKATIEWRKGSDEAENGGYSRDHTWSFHSLEVLASAAPEYMGSAERVNPEEAFVAALSSCHMLTFLAIAAKRKHVVESYVDKAVGYLERNESGQMAITRVVLRPEVSFKSGTALTDAELDTLHQSAHKNCFIANSVTTDVKIEI